MQIQLLYFARLREAFDCAGETVQLPDGASVGDLLQLLQARGGVWLDELTAGRVVRAAVNQTMSSADRALADGDEVALFPPVTGG